jgi:uncharacterized protein YqeY
MRAPLEGAAACIDAPPEFPGRAGSLEFAKDWPVTLSAKITDDMKSAMRAGDKSRVAALRLILAEVKQREVDSREMLDDDAVQSVIEKLIKQGRDAAAQFGSGGREDLVAKELAEVDIFETYLPQAMSDAAINTLIAVAIESTGATSAKDMGRVMAQIKSGATGRVDMRVVSERVREALSG